MVSLLGLNVVRERRPNMLRWKSVPLEMVRSTKNLDDVIEVEKMVCHLSNTVPQFIIKERHNVTYIIT